MTNYPQAKRYFGWTISLQSSGRRSRMSYVSVVGMSVERAAEAASQDGDVAGAGGEEGGAALAELEARAGNLV